MSLRSDHPDWPVLTSDTLENPKRAGRSWVCTCPLCHTHHLNVDRRTGLFKCWYIGCEFRGILEDFRKNPVDNDRYRHTHGTPKFGNNGNNGKRRPNPHSCCDTNADGWQILGSDNDRMD